MTKRVIASPAAPQSRNLIELSEAGDRLAVCSRTMRRYVARGLLTGYRVGPRLIRVDAAEVDAFAQCVPTAEIA